MRGVMTAEQVLERLGGRAVLSHETAARLHGIEFHLDDGTERVSVPRARHGRGAAGWVVHRADVGIAETEARDGLRCTDLLRTLTDLARVLDHQRAVVALDSALRLGLVHVSELAPMGRCWGRGAARVRAAHAALDPLSGSVLETLLRLALADSGLTSPKTQYRVTDHGHEVARVDFCWPEQRLIVEADGFAYHSGRDDYRRDRQRMNELERLGWRVLRFTWEDVVHRPAHVVALVRACLAQDLRSAA
jgi:very-short-patch-repair endonuclease